MPFAAGLIQALGRVFLCDGCRRCSKQPGEALQVNLRQRKKVCGKNAFVDLVNAGVDGTELNDLTAVFCNKTSVGGAPSGGELGVDHADCTNALLNNIAEGTGGRKVGVAAKVPVNGVA